MKILHYVEGANLSFRIPWIDLIKELARRGIEQRVLCRRGGNVEEAVRENGVDVVVWQPILTNFPPINIQYPLILKSFAPDIVHTRLSSAANIAGFWNRLFGVPTIAMLDGKTKWKYYNKVDHFTACSAWIKKDMMISNGVPDDQIDVLYNAIDTTRFHHNDTERSAFRKQLGLSVDDVAFIGTGGFFGRKGFDILIRAFSNLARSYANIKLLLVGDGPEKESLIRIMNEAGTADRVIFSDGYQKDIRPWMSAGDYFVLPSREEPFGIVILEAMASGLPVIVTRSGGPEEIITDGEDGLIVEPGDIDGLSAAMKQISIMGGDAKLNMKENMRRRLQCFSCETVASHLVEIYEKILSNK